MNRLDSDRRRFLGTLGTLGGGLFGALAASWLDPRAARAAGAAAPSPAKASACIVLWMNGGPSHVDTFDPKPGTPVAGPFKAIRTRAKGVSICEHLPRVADQAHHLAVLRGMSSREGNHDRARYLLHTGYAPNPTVIHPALGGWMSEELGPSGDLPTFISLGGPSATAGFLGAQHGPFIVTSAVEPPENVARAPGVGPARFEKRRAALAKIEAHFAAEATDVKVDGRRAVYEKAIRMMRAPGLGAFDLSSEPRATLDAYGDTDFGRRCVTARRLIESGVRLVEVTLDGWDTHTDNFGRTTKLMAALDPGMSALVSDLDKRHLLDKTLVIWMGDFGRTPRINGNDGRDHHPGAWSAVLAGGGVRGGAAHGETDATGDTVASGKIAVPDLFATVARQLGLDPDKSFDTPSGRPIAISDGGRVLHDLTG
ncbi:MAG: DUF1501 domain-containing protein [Byssovorax sp.]